MTIGIIGLGIMGTALGSRLLDHRTALVVFNRTKEKASGLIERGALWAESPAEAAAQCDIAITFVTNPTAVEAVTSGPNGIMASLPADSVHCDMSTVAPAWAARLATDYASAGKQFVQAPVLGSKPQIEQGNLLVLAGGEASAIEKCRPLLELCSTRQWLFASAEQAATTKLACNMMIAHMIIGLGQSMLFAKKGDVEPAVLLDIIQSSNLASAMYGSKGKSILDRSFKANFVVDNMLKDLDLATGAGIAAGMPLPLASLAREMFVSASAHGYGGEDYSAVVKVLEAMAGVVL